ncbi:hypothetical protein RFI_31961 [Reticulomyxa filosa]|uniref:Uncharacterized protein n=1 Tax=Reticulomyxa filosa TaxID=46433 RepID=X6LXK2_RETFI|nr:hypothetical protein RFI_31961 [Reticulomyxa filosa]|eukprot:ETO05435.1 hypothetical protein RFI_31961 [Reticulomyxa filosa]
MLKDYKSHYLGSNDKYEGSRGDKKHRSGSNSTSNGRKMLNHYHHSGNSSKSAILDNRDLIKEAQKWIAQSDHNISEREYQKGLQQEMSMLNSANANPELSFEEQRKQRMERLKRLELKQKACVDTLDKKVDDRTPQVAQPTTPQLNVVEDKHAIPKTITTSTSITIATATAGPTSSCTIIPTVDVNGISASTTSAIGNGPTEHDHYADSDSKNSNDNGSIHTLNDNNNNENDNNNNGNNNNNNNNNNNVEVLSASLPTSTVIDVDVDMQVNSDTDDEKTKSNRITTIAKNMISSDAYDELQVAHSEKNDEGFDLFSESLDFEKEIVKQTTVTRSVGMLFFFFHFYISNNYNNLHLTENWDDSEGYYVFRLNDRIKDRYACFLSVYHVYEYIKFLTTILCVYVFFVCLFVCLFALFLFLFYLLFINLICLFFFSFCFICNFFLQFDFGQ